MDPPASLPLLWRFLGWLEKGAARWLWAGITVFFKPSNVAATSTFGVVFF